MNALPGKIVRTTNDPSSLIPAQISGNCTWAGLVAVLHENLSTGDYAKVSYEIAMDGICKYYQSNFSKMTGADIILLKRTSSLLAQMALDTHHRRFYL